MHSLYDTIVYYTQKDVVKILVQKYYNFVKSVKFRCRFNKSRLSTFYSIIFGTNKTICNKILCVDCE